MLLFASLASSASWCACSCMRCSSAPGPALPTDTLSGAEWSPSSAAKEGRGPLCALSLLLRRRPGGSASAALTPTLLSKLVLFGRGRLPAGAPAASAAAAAVLPSGGAAAGEADGVLPSQCSSIVKWKVEPCPSCG